MSRDLQDKSFKIGMLRQSGGFFKNEFTFNSPSLQMRNDCNLHLIFCLCSTDFQTPIPLLSAGYSPICPPCDNEMKTDAMLEHLCASEFGKHPPNTHCASAKCEKLSAHSALIRLDMYHSTP